MDILRMNTGLTSDSISKNENPLSLKKGIKAYRDEMLTGLTDEELEEIKARAKSYLEKNPIKSKADRESYENFVKSLLKDYGYKGDVDDYALSLGSDAENELETEQNQQQQTAQSTKPASVDLFQRSTLSTMSLKNKFFYETE